MATKKILKAISAGLVTSAIAVGAVTPAFAGEQLGRTSFAAGVGLPWHTCESGAETKLKFDVAKSNPGTYNIEVVNPGGKDRGGESWWDAQFRHRKLTIVSGRTYEVKYTIKADHAGTYVTKIGNQTGDVEVWHNEMGKDGKGFDQSWDGIKINANQEYTFSQTFTANKGGEGWEWAFHFGGKGEHHTEGDAFPGVNWGSETVKLHFSNMSLMDKTGNDNDWATKYGEVNPYDNQIHNAVRVNQIGYYTNLAKKATVVLADNDTSTYPFTVVDSSGKVVFEGTSLSGGKDKDSGQNTAILDFSALNNVKGDGFVIKMGGGYTAPASAGEMKTKIGSAESYPFSIGDNLYIDAKSQKNVKTVSTADPIYNSSNLFKDAFNYFYQNRATIALNSQYITSGDKTNLASRGEASALDTAEIQKLWINSYGAEYPGTNTAATTGKNITAKYGWYDAGDHGKYVVNGGIAVWTLANTYERALKLGNAAQMDEWINIPDITGTGAAKANVPKILQECQVELDFFMDMIVTSANGQYGVMYDLTTNTNGASFDATGMVYHKLHDFKWTALGVKPIDDTLARIVKPPTTAATLNASATFAQAARLFKGYDDSLSAKYLAAAKSTYEAAKKNDKVYAPMNQAIGGGPYGDDNVLDDFYWAACELFVTTEEATYKTDLESFNFRGQSAYTMTYDLSGGENNGSCSSFNWGNTAGLGSLTLWLNKEKLDKTSLDKLEKSITDTADFYIDVQKSQGYGLPYMGTEFRDEVNRPGEVFNGYEWGSNSFVINNAIVMAYAYDVSKDKKYINGTVEAMDYLLGRNAMDFSYVTGYGSFHLMFPHHRFWAPETDSSFPFAPAGVLSGGPNIGMQDPYIGGAGLSPTTPTQFAFIDSAESWSTNEVTINWNAPLVWIVKYLDDVAPTVDIEVPPITTPTTTPTTTTPTTTPSTPTGPTTAPTTPTGPTTPNPPGTLMGDVNLDEEVNTADLILLAKVVGNRTPMFTGQALINANCNKGAGVNGDDLLALIKFLTNRAIELPL